MENLRLTIIQSEIVWQNAEENLNRLERTIKDIDTQSDLIILPEMFNTGFTMSPAQVSEEMDGITARFLLRMAREVKSDITGSIPVKENGRFFNRLLWASPGGELFAYDKRHLFRMAGEEKIYSRGTSLLDMKLKGWNIRPFICYDLRFPVWTRNQNMEYDLAIFTANWPSARDLHWDTLLRARAIENQCFVAGVNRTGTDGNGVTYNGRSAIIDYYGNTVFISGDTECTMSAELSYENLLSYRNSFSAWKDGDEYRIQL